MRPWRASQWFGNWEDRNVDTDERWFVAVLKVLTRHADGIEFLRSQQDSSIGLIFDQIIEHMSDE
jgi:hypothetical protein